MQNHTTSTILIGAVLSALSVSACTMNGDESSASEYSTVDPASAMPLAACGAILNPTVPGGEAHWTITCGPDFATIDGWVKDTRADGKCAWVKAFNDFTGEQMLPHAKACPAGAKTNFNWTAYQTHSISAYLYTE